MVEGAREALEALPGRLTLGRGGLRLFAEFQDGKLAAPVKIAVFRVPPRSIDQVNYSDVRRLDLDAGQLEKIAAMLELDTGATELVVEYADAGDGPRLHWIDFSWSQAA